MQWPECKNPVSLYPPKGSDLFQVGARRLHHVRIEGLNRISWTGARFDSQRATQHRSQRPRSGIDLRKDYLETLLTRPQPSILKPIPSLTRQVAESLLDLERDLYKEWFIYLFESPEPKGMEGFFEAMAKVRVRVDFHRSSPRMRVG